VGAEIVALTLALELGFALLQINTFRKAERQYRLNYLRQVVISQCAILLFLVAGIWVLALGKEGFAWFLPAVLLSYLAALSEAWVLLIEIKR
jgi:modulator of FtsH protease